jgi:adenosylhomocysteine nucleosidase
MTNARRACLLFCVCLLTLVPLAPLGRAQSPPASVLAAGQAGLPTDLVVQGAVDTELQPLLAALEDKEEIQIAAWTFWRGRIGARRVVVSRTEVGAMNASVATTLAIAHFRPRLIINQGTAGALHPDLALYDIVVGEATVDYGAFRSARAGAGDGVKQSRWTPMPTMLRLDGKERTAFPQFPGDQAATQVAVQTPNPRGRVVKGTIGSAFEFNREIDRLVWINKTYGAVSEDMESAFAAGTAAGFGTRLLAIRIISDSEFRSTEFMRIAGEYCAAFVLDVIKRLP